MKRGRRLALECLEAREMLDGSGAGPTAIVLHLASSPEGDYADVIGPRVVLEGRTAPGAEVTLDRGGRPMGRAVADASGAFGFTEEIGPGPSRFTARAVAATGGEASASLAVTRANEVIAWNSVALQAVRTARLQAPDSARALAIVQLSVFDAVNAIDRSSRSYGVAVKKPAGPTSAVMERAAADDAAEAALAGLFPGQSAALGAQLSVALNALPGGSQERRGAALGAAVAGRMLALRSGDGSAVKVAYHPGSGPDSWVPTPPAYATAVDPQWGRVTPFALAGGSQFRPPPPPAPSSAEFAAEVAQVESLGGAKSTTRTPDETAVAHFWSDLAGTFDPPGHWNQIAEVAAGARRSGLVASARTFALLDMALADAGIEAWGAKYAFATARPVTVIRDGADGANPQIVADPSWTPLWPTPAFPSYISGHSTFSASAATVLDSIYGSHFAFTDTGDPSLHLPPRSFTGFDQAAREAGMSRIYGGIHFLSDNLAGLEVGTEVGRFVARHALRPRG